MPRDLLPLKPPDDYVAPKTPTPAPAWVALLSAWLSLFVLIGAIVFCLLPGSKHPVAELEHREPYSLKDRFLPFPIYGIAVALFVSIVVLWQMRKEPRPLPDAMVNQRIQAYAGIALSLIATAIVYGYVALHGPK